MDLVLFDCCTNYTLSMDAHTLQLDIRYMFGSVRKLFLFFFFICMSDLDGDNNNCIQRCNWRFLTISSLHRKLSPTQSPHCTANCLQHNLLTAPQTVSNTISSLHHKLSPTQSPHCTANCLQHNLLTAPQTVSNTISSLHRKLSPTHTLKWPGHNRVQITCNTSSAYHVQHVVWCVTWYEGTAQLLCFTEFISH